MGVKMTTVEPQGPKRRTFPKLLLGIAIVAAGFLLVAMLSSGAQNLKVSVRESGEVRELTVVNTGNDPIHIQDVMINGRDDCSRYKLFDTDLVRMDEAKYPNGYLHKLWVADGQPIYFGERNGQLINAWSGRPLSAEPIELKTGDSASWLSHCDSQIVNATVTTESGTANYTFR